jgi:benzoate-CoA ligase family protein
MDNAASTFVDAPVEEGHGDRPALVTSEQAFTYAELRRLTDRAAHGLRALGVEPEHRVALLLPDGIAFAATFFAAIKLGAVAVPLNTRLGPADHCRMLRDSRARVLVGPPDLTSPLAPHRRDLPLRAMVGFAELLADSTAPLVAEPVGLDAMAFWLYTSGTTGQPKAAVHCHRTLLACRHYAQEVLGVTSADRIFASSKLFFAYALGNALMIPLFARASAYLDPRWGDAASIGAVMREYRPTLFFSVPTLYARLLRENLPGDTFRSTRACVSAGERLPASVYAAWRERFGVEILDGIGATETVFMVLSNRPRLSRAGSTGTPVPGTEVRLLDGDGQPAPDGEDGVLWVRTPSAAAGYWQRLELSRRAFVGEWFRTGDVYHRDADGFYFHRGREDDFFKVAGMWVVPAQVESAVLDHPGVIDAAVVGGEEGSGLLKPVLFVVPREGPDGRSASDLAADLRGRLRERLAPHQLPRGILVVPELPRTATGKLQRFKLREEASRLARDASG